MTAEDREIAGPRIRYWFDDGNIDDLIRLDRAIRRQTYPYSPHRKFFQCAFSAILKATLLLADKIDQGAAGSGQGTSRGHGIVREPGGAHAAGETPRIRSLLRHQGTRISARNFLGKIHSRDKADLIVTSPPYVTSYNYADIHQLSTLWLGYASDYRLLRKNMLGNRYGVHAPRPHVIRKLGNAAWRTYLEMGEQDAGHASSIARYMVDLDKAVRGCWNVLEKGGMAVFVIGNTQYKGVKIDNAEHLEASMERSGFEAVSAIPRKVSR